MRQMAKMCVAWLAVGAIANSLSGFGTCVCAVLIVIVIIVQL